ncbi:MAG: DNA primase [Actinomycetota bacterium]
MAGRIRQDDIEAVRERTDLAKIVAGYLTLRKAGHDSLVGICPFHTEKTPSFNVSPSKGLYYCHGCGAGGDAVKFLQAVEHLSFPEAIERLAQDTGVQLRYEAESPGERRAASKRDALHRANDEAGSIFHRTLMEAPEATEAREYLSKRGIDRETAERFGVGYSPPSADFLLRSLGRKVSTELLLEAGLASRDASGGVRDRFRDRITFPIHDLSGRAVAFGARQLKDAPGQPKYLNSSESEVYKKGHVLYNLHRAKAALTRTGDAYVVEGYTDVIALYQAGVETGVATCGTALGDAHFRLLSRFAKRAILAFDSDEAGARAAQRAYELHQAHPLEVRVLLMPDGLDPADFVRQHGAEAFHDLAKQAVPLVQFMLDRTLVQFDPGSVESRTQAANACVPLLDAIHDVVTQEQYVHYVADRLSVSDAALTAKLGALPAGNGAAAVEQDPGLRKLPPQHQVEREMLRLMARSSPLYTHFAPRFSALHFDRAQHRKLFEILVAGGGDVRSIVAEADDERLVGQLASLVTEPIDGEPTQGYAQHLALRLEEFELQRRIDSLKRDLERLNPMKDPSYEERFIELSKLEGARRKVREQAEHR